ncbi:LptF/LptG family permease [Sulfurospirillum sp. T05]|uniref:LptF/LptG family permease n=1 Tax=Sulfurospirillum tamanense TaxID=2813362 RepID=A0ABS2WP02_9BACT|nr:LptF/LptG family permease [Sulfurospirillum tamanensis]MBN2963417.1 LptF/LptG family permease [Sulfurospirillum tamanensis]
MTKLYQRYVGMVYLKNVVVIFVGLVFFYAGVDLITNVKDLPDSANLQLLYVALNALTAVNYALPLAIVFGMIVSKFSMIRSNELICMYAAGISKTQLLKPLFVCAMALTTVYISLNFTPFVYAYEYRSHLLKNHNIAPISSDLFLKYETRYVYITTLDPIKQEAQGIKIFDVEGTRLKSVMEAKRGVFQRNEWYLEDVTLTQKPTVESLESPGLNVTTMPHAKALQGFKPKIIENAHQGGIALTIVDALDALHFFSAQGIDTKGVKTSLYTMVLFPLFAPLMVVILYFFLPASARFFNLALLSFMFVIATLSTWGLLFVLSKFSTTGVILPELGIALPIAVMAGIALSLFYQHR